MALTLKERMQRNKPLPVRGKTFEHVAMEFEYSDLEADTQESGRTYLTPNGKKYPSITTVLSLLTKKYIDEWKERVGEEEAARVSYRAGNRGSAFHDLTEQYLNNNPRYTDGYTHNIIGYFNNIRPILDERVGRVYAQEYPLYSDYLGVAGRVDCVAEFDGEIAIIDFKTSRREKSHEKIHNYFIQESAYAIMWEERFKMPITKLVTIMHVDHKKPMVFVEHRDNWTAKLLETIKMYKEGIDNG